MGTIQADPSDTPGPSQHDRLVTLLVNATAAVGSPVSRARADVMATMVERSDWLIAERES